jgi:hypothetical protein
MSIVREKSSPKTPLLLILFNSLSFYKKDGSYLFNNDNNLTLNKDGNQINFVQTFTQPDLHHALIIVNIE